MSSFLESLTERVLVLDGGMGTQIHSANLGLDDYDGFEGNSEILNITRPDVIRAIHSRYLESGADAVETNTFGANLTGQGEYGIADRIEEINLAGARLAREAVDAHGSGWVFGSIGPGTKAPSLAQIPFDDLREGYRRQVGALVEGGVDVLIIETVFDLLQAKSALAGVMDIFDATGVDLPVICQVTIETTGTMLLGSEIGAALTALDPYSIVDVIGVNCATGPAEMIEHIRHLCRHSRKPVSVLPNAGIPEVRDGAAYFPLTPEEFVRHHLIFIEEFGVSLVGGCCGTTTEHIAALRKAVDGATRATRDPQPEPAMSSLYSAAPFDQDNSWFVIGERCNTNGSRAFKELVTSEDWDGTVDVAKAQVREGAHALDVCVDYVGRDGVADIREVVSRLRTAQTLPLVIDSTEPEVIEEALKLVGGRCVINSINLEEGFGPDTRLEKNLRLARTYGAGVVALAIEESGQATTCDWKVAVCQRLYDTAIEWGLEPQDIIFDTLVFPVSTGMEEARNSGVETLNAIKAVKEKFPGTYTSLGISNVSFGLNPAGRRVLNSMFLHEAVAHGLDMAIAGRITPLHKIPDEKRDAALDLIYNRHPDALTDYMALFEAEKLEGYDDGPTLADLPLDERLKQRIVEGDSNDLEADLTEALTNRSALVIINELLLDGMKTVGELFGRGEMQLPFVLQSAEVMKRSVAFLEPHMEKSDSDGKGTIVLATVRGDVHDIGKNLVDIILTNNGYNVVNIGIKQPLDEIVNAAIEHDADAIGMSGLLVKSTLVMRDNLEEMNRRNLSHFPVLLGGAALNRGYVDGELASLYEGRVYYGRDAFDGLRLLDEIVTAKRDGTELPANKTPRRSRQPRDFTETSVDTRRSDEVTTDVDIPQAPFFGVRKVAGISIPSIADWVNTVTLFRAQWGYKRTKGQSAEEYEEFLAEEAHGILRDLIDLSTREGILEPAVTYGYYPVNSEGNSLIVFDPETDTEIGRFEFPRQSTDRRLCLADFFTPVDSGVRDVLGVQLVTMGKRVTEYAHELKESGRYRDYLHMHGFGVEMAEALAEMWHARVRAELKIDGDDSPDLHDLFQQGYRGSRYSFGYPACPRLEDQAILLPLLDAGSISVELTEEFQLVPEQSTSAIVVHHPQAKYFSVDR